MTIAADGATYSAVSQFKSTPSELLPAMAHMFGPSAPTTIGASSRSSSVVAPSRTRASPPCGFPEPMPTISRCCGSPSSSTRSRDHIRGLPIERDHSHAKQDLRRHLRRGAQRRQPITMRRVIDPEGVVAGCFGRGSQGTDDIVWQCSRHPESAPTRTPTSVGCHPASAPRFSSHHDQ